VQPMQTWRRRLSLCALLALAAAAAPHAQDYTAEIEAWRAEREAGLAADDGWLTVAGLFFLTEGDNTFGSSPLNDIVLRTGPDNAGVFTLRRGEITVRAAAGATLTIDGHDTEGARLWPYEGRSRPTITLGPLSLFGHYSGDRLAIRMRDRDGEIRRDFSGLRWFPVAETFRVRGRYLPHAEPRTVELPNILGDVEMFRTSGSVAFSVGGEDLRMTAFDAGGQLWFIFRDLTSGSETYPAARFLYADAAENGWTTLDFNRAYNPPCAFNPYTTCPLPPAENRLPVRIEAGEMNYHGAND
jgi:uncharacterized protein (DUF1684 family)